MPAGAPDPRLLQFLFARQDAERQARADAEAAQFEQMLKLRDDARKERDAQLSQAKALLDLENARAGVEDRQGAQMKTAKAVAPALGRTQMLDATTGSDATAFVPGGAPDNLLGVLQQLGAGPAVLGQFVGGAEDQLMAPIVSRQRAQAGADAAALGIGRDQAFSNIQTGAGLAQATADRVEQEKLDATIAQETRAEQRADREARASYYRDVDRFGAQVQSLQNRIDRAREASSRAPVRSEEARRQALIASRLESRMSRLLNENLSGEFVNNQKYMVEEIALVQDGESAIADLQAFRDYAAQNPQFLGTTRGGFTNLIASIFETGADVASVGGGPVGDAIVGISNRFRDGFVSNGSLTDAQRAKVASDAGLSDDGTLQARVDAKTLTARVAYLVTAASNPGRFSNEQYQQNLKRFALDEGTAAGAMRRLESAISEISGVVDRTRNRISLFERVVPGASGGFVGQDGNVVLAPSGRTDFRTFDQRNTAPKQPRTESGVPIDTSLSAPRTSPTTNGNRLGVTADQFSGLNTLERAAVIESLLESRQ